MKAAYKLLIIAVLVLSCEKEVKLNLRNENKLIVDGLVTDVKGYNYIRLYSLLDYYSNASPDSISGALVSVTDSMGNTSVFKEKPNTHGLYSNETFQGSVGEIYKLQIQYNGNIYESSSKIAPIIVKIGVTYKENLNQVAFEFSLSQKDTNYYRLCIFVNDSLLNALQWLYIFDGHHVQTGFDPERYIPHHQSDSLKVEEQSLTKSAYLYYFNLASYMNSQEQPFNVPSVFPSGNISNGALGIFRASSIVSTKLRFIQ
jgi:Domain of unknown function (DUF4249)